MYIFLKNKYSHSTIKSYQHLCSPVAATLSKNPKIEHVVLDGMIGCSFTWICFLMSFSSINFGFIILENQSFSVFIVNFNLTENNSAGDVDF